MIKNEFHRNLHSEFDLSEITKEVMRKKEIHFVRQYLAFLELGYSATDLCIVHVPDGVTSRSDGLGEAIWRENSYLTLKSNIDKES